MEFISIYVYYASFRTSPRILKKGLPPLGPSKGGREAKGDKLRNIPALDFKTLVPPTRKTSGDTDPPTSPIEDITLNPSATPRSLQAGASELYLEIQQRVAQHTSAKRRDKVIRKSTEPGDAMDHGASAIMYVSSSSSPLSSSPPLPVASVPAKGSSKKLQSSSTTLQSKKSTKAAKGKKEKPALMTPVEYAQQLQDKAKARTAAAVEKDHDLQPSPSKFLHGKTIFYTGGDMTYASVRTRGRMDKIVRHGGTLVPRFDASVVTHIVTDAPYPSTLRALGLKNLSDIPDHIPTVKWNWIVTSIGRSPTLTEKGLRVRMDEVWLWAAFLERMDAGTEPRPPSRANGKGKGKAHIPENTEFSLISEFTQDRPRRASSARSIHEAPDTEDESEGGGSGGGDGPKGALLYPPTSPERHRKRASSSLSKLPVAGPSSNGTPQEDPLAEFYDLARAEHEIGWARRGEVEEPEATPSDSDIEEPLAAPAPRKRGWTCDKREVQRQTCVNQDIIDKLGELKTLHQAKLGDDDRWRAFSYSKCIPALRNHPKRITSFAEARAIRGVGEKTAIKIMEIVKTGELRRIGYEKTEDFRTTQLFQGVYGVGQSTGYRWYAAGCRTLEDVLVGKGGVSTSPAQEIGIRFYDDINNRMPREEAREIFELIKPIALDIDPKLYVEIMGSYRRGKADCGDIDILITRPTDDGNTHKGVLSRLLKALHIAGILTEDLALPENPDDLEAIYRGLSRVPGREGARRRRIDFLTVPWHSRGAALLYYTGDDIFNRAIRMKAGVLGYSLNQKGLFAGVVRDPRDRRIKLNAGTVVASETEEEIFKILNVPWQEPHERVRG
ncbi:DNA polymerase lambda [Lyophyllum atratum]|nr:DNA polymerase lambda [Lyophyllum atratum]